MSFTINNAKLEARIQKIADRQLVKTSKRSMAEQILAAAVGDGRGRPADKWAPRAHAFVQSLGGSIEESPDGTSQPVTTADPSDATKPLQPAL